MFRLKGLDWVSAVALCIPALNVVVGAGLVLIYLAKMVVEKRFFYALLCVVLAFLLVCLGAYAFQWRSYLMYGLFCVGCFAFVGWCSAVENLSRTQAAARIKKAQKHRNFDFIFGSHTLAGVDIAGKIIVFTDRHTSTEVRFDEVMTYKLHFIEKPHRHGDLKYEQIRIIFETKRIANPNFYVYIDDMEQAELTMSRLRIAFS